jgi:hypothetical protein
VGVNPERLRQELRDKLDAAITKIQMQEAQMAINHPMMNAQNSVLGVLGAANQYQGSQVQDPRRWGYDDPMNGMKVEVINAQNGFILKTAPYEGAVAQLHIAANINELRDLITAEMVSKKLGK